MDPRSTEGGGEALVLLQVGQRVAVELHGLARQPAAESVDALLHPASEISVRRESFAGLRLAASYPPAHELVPSVHVEDFPPGVRKVDKSRVWPLTAITETQTLSHLKGMRMFISSA